MHNPSPPPKKKSWPRIGASPPEKKFLAAPLAKLVLAKNLLQRIGYHVVSSSFFSIKIAANASTMASSKREFVDGIVFNTAPIVADADVTSCPFVDANKGNKASTAISKMLEEMPMEFV